MNREMLPFILFLLYTDDLKNQTDRIILGISNDRDNKSRLLESRLTDLKNQLTEEESQWYQKLKGDMENQGRLLSQQIAESSRPTEVAAEIMEALKTNESDFFDRAANYVFMYYSEIIDEIKAGNQAIGKIRESVLELKEKINDLGSHS